MFDAVRNNKRIVQVFLALITLPFAFWGVDSYVRNSGAGSDLASVGDTKITIYQYEQAMRDRQDQMRRALGDNYKPEVMNTPEARMSVLNALVDQRLLLLEAQKQGLQTSDEALRNFISRIPALQEEGKFSMARYEAALRAQGIAQPQFEGKLRQDLTLQQLVGTIGESAFVSENQATAMLRLQSEERQYSEIRIAPEQFADKVKIDDTAAQKFYADNKSRFEVPEQVKAEFVVLSLDSLLTQATVAEGEVKGWYDSHQDRFLQPEERRASHILIVTKTDADKAAAKAKAEEVLKEVRKAPAKFAELAKQYSQDPGSAQKGGDLGFFARGMMVKPFEDTVFKLKDGEISSVLESEFGFHIIKLTGIKPGKVRTFDEARPEIENELKNQAAARKFAEAAESFTNTVYEQSDSLQPVADKFKLKIQRTDWLPRNPEGKDMAALGPLANQKIYGALFSDDAVKNKRNTEAVEVAPSTLVAARVLEFVPATTRPFETVKTDIEKYLKAQEAAAMAKNSGEAKLAELQKGDDKLAWSPLKNASRMQSAQLPPATLQALFKADVEKLPAYVGSGLDGNYMLYKIVKVNRPETIDAAQRKALQGEYGAIVAQEDLAAYIAGLRARYKINVNKTALDSKERQ